MEGLRYSYLDYREAIERGLAPHDVALEAINAAAPAERKAHRRWWLGGTHGRRKHPSRITPAAAFLTRGGGNFHFRPAVWRVTACRR